VRAGGVSPGRFLPKLGWSLVLFDEMGRVFHFAIPKKWLRRALVWSGIALAVTVALFARYIYVETQMQLVADKRRMLEEVRALQDQLRTAYDTESELRKKIDDLSARLDVKQEKQAPAKSATKKSSAQPSGTGGEAKPGPGIGGRTPVAGDPDPVVTGEEPAELDDIFLEQARSGVVRWESRWKTLWARMTRLEQEVQRREELLTKIPSGSPLLRPLEITSSFGGRPSPFESGREFHGGVDLKAERGDPVLATADGVVESAGWTAGLGRTVKIAHPTGFTTEYGHMSALLVKAGDRVRRGEVIGRAGSSGRSTGPHLHYEVHYGKKRLNPAPFLNLTIEQVDEALKRFRR
jgi:murein DD-endopeptidase MepM/ murein hydrolase activator NlpD